MPDYKDSKIYQIISSQCEQVYIGSTCQTLSMRLAGHRRDYKQFQEGKKQGHCRSFQLLDYDDVKIELIEDFPCERREQLLKREGEIIRQRNCLNVVVPGRTPKEYNEDNKEKKRMYNETNKEHLKARRKVYREANKDSLQAKKKAWYKSNKERIQTQRKVYHEINREQILAKHKAYYEANREQILAKQKKYRKQKIEPDDKATESSMD